MRSRCLCYKIKGRNISRARKIACLSTVHKTYFSGIATGGARMVNFGRVFIFFPSAILNLMWVSSSPNAFPSPQDSAHEIRTPEQAVWVRIRTLNIFTLQHCSRATFYSTQQPSAATRKNTWRMSEREREEVGERREFTIISDGRWITGTQAPLFCGCSRLIFTVNLFKVRDQS